MFTTLASLLLSTQPTHAWPKPIPEAARPPLVATLPLGDWRGHVIRFIDVENGVTCYIANEGVSCVKTDSENVKPTP